MILKNQPSSKDLIFSKEAFLYFLFNSFSINVEFKDLSFPEFSFLSSKLVKLILHLFVLRFLFNSFTLIKLLLQMVSI